MLLLDLYIAAVVTALAYRAFKGASQAPLVRQDPPEPPAPRKVNPVPQPGGPLARFQVGIEADGVPIKMLYRGDSGADARRTYERTVPREGEDVVFFDKGVLRGRK